MKKTNFMEKLPLFCGIAVLILLLVGLYLEKAFEVKDFSAHLLQVYQETFEVAFPEGTEEQFHVSTEQGPHGEYTAYAVYQLTEDYEEFFQDFEAGHRPDVESAFLENMDQLEIPDESKPDFSKAYCARHKGRNNGDHLYMVFHEDTKQLYTLLIFS